MKPNPHYFISFESIAEARDSIMSLGPGHGAELTRWYESKAPVNPIWEFWEALEKIGKFKILALRETSTLKLVGYFMYSVVPEHNYRHCLNAVVNNYYIIPELRAGTGLGLWLIDCGLAMMESEPGVMISTVGERAWQSYAAIWQRRGYILQDLVYTKLVRSSPHAAI